MFGFVFEKKNTANIEQDIDDQFAKLPQIAISPPAMELPIYQSQIVKIPEVLLGKQKYDMFFFLYVANLREINICISQTKKRVILLYLYDNNIFFLFFFVFCMVCGIRNQQKIKPYKQISKLEKMKHYLRININYVKWIHLMILLQLFELVTLNTN